MVKGCEVMILRRDTDEVVTKAEAVKDKRVEVVKMEYWSDELGWSFKKLEQ